MNFKRVLGTLICLVMVLSVFAGCGSGGGSSTGGTTAPAADGGSADAGDADTGDSPAQETTSDGSTVGRNTHVEGGTEMELWTFQELHVQFYTEMADIWNEQNPDRPINMTVTTGESIAMHTKMLVALQSGTGAPDIMDIEIGQFGNFLKGNPVLLPLNDIVEPHKDDIVMSRLEMYSDNDGNIYGIDFHVGAAVTYYNMDIMDEAGVDPASIVTWDDYVEAGKQVLETTGKVMTAVETRDLFFPQLMMLEKNAQYVTDTGEPNIATQDHAEVIDYIRMMMDEGIVEIAAGGGFHQEEWYGYMNGGNVASISMPLWYMGRFTDYMTDLSGKVAIHPVPVWNAGDVRSVCQGGTGTAVTEQAKDPEFAKEFLIFAKLGEEGNRYIWEKLGFDPIRTTLWTDTSITNASGNKFLEFFTTNPFDVLNEVGADLVSTNIKGGYAPTYSVLTSTTYQNAFETSPDQDAAELLEYEQSTIIYEG